MKNFDICLSLKCLKKHYLILSFSSRQIRSTLILKNILNSDSGNDFTNMLSYKIIVFRYSFYTLCRFNIA